MVSLARHTKITRCMHAESEIFSYGLRASGLSLFVLHVESPSSTLRRTVPTPRILLTMSTEADTAAVASTNGIADPLTPQVPTEAKMRRKARKAEIHTNNKKVTEELTEIGEKMNKLLEDAATRLDVDLQQLTGKFLAKTSAVHEVKPTAWNGLVAMMAADPEWSKMKRMSFVHMSTPQELTRFLLFAHPGVYKGATYMNYVVQRIIDEQIYTNMSEADKKKCIEYAQKNRDAKISAGTAKTEERRLTQGNVSTELYNMCNRVS